MHGTPRTHLDDGEDRAEPDADDEHEQEDAVEARVALRVEDGEQDEPAAADEGPEDREPGEHALAPPHGRDESAAPFGEEIA